MASHSFLLTSSFPLMVRSQQHLLSLSKCPLYCTTAVVCKTAQAWILFSTMLATDTLTFPGPKVAAATVHQHKRAFRVFGSSFTEGLASLTNHYLHP